MRGSDRLSTHAWAAAIDINPARNQFGQKGAMPEKVVELFKAEGWTWGGEWRKPDPMHFEATSGR